jgi:hypothetical protein
MSARDLAVHSLSHVTKPDIDKHGNYDSTPTARMTCTRNVATVTADCGPTTLDDATASDDATADGVPEPACPRSTRPRRRRASAPTWWA